VLFNRHMVANEDSNPENWKVFRSIADLQAEAKREKEENKPVSH